MTLMVHITKLWLLISLVLFRICCVLSSLLPQYLLEADKIAKEREHWKLNPVGKVVAEFLQAFITTTIEKDIADVLRNSDKKNFSKNLYSVVLQTFIYQIPVFTVIIVLFVVAFFLIALPYYISLYRTEKSLRVNDPDAKEALIKLGKNGFVWFECFVATVLIAVFGILITGYASITIFNLLQAPFLYFDFTVNATYWMKQDLLHTYEYKQWDISSGPHDRIMLLKNINDDIYNSFKLANKAFVNPYLDVATSMEWQISQAKFTLKHQRAMLLNFTQNTSSVVENSLKLFTTYIQAVKNETTSDTSKLDLLLEIPQLNITINSTLETYDEPIKTLTDAVKLNISASVQAVNQELAQLALKVKFDPSELVEKMEEFSFETHEKVQSTVSNYLAVAKKSVNIKVVESFRSLLHDMMANFKNETFPLFVFIYSICILCLACVLMLAMAYLCAVGGTRCLSRDENEQIRKSKISNRSGYVLLFFCYSISMFLWICWLCNIYFFLMTALQLELCNSVNDLSFFSATLDNVSYRKSTHFYSMFSSEELNSTVRQNIIDCQKDNDYFAPTSYDLRNFLSILKTNMSSNLENVTYPFNEGLKNLSPFNFSSSESTIMKLKSILENVDTVSVPKELNAYLQQVKTIGVLKILGEIANNTNSSASTLNYTILATTSYESLTSSVNSLIYKSELFEKAMKTLNNTLQSVVRQMEYLNWTADAFHGLMVNESSKALPDILNRTIQTKIEEMIFDLGKEISDFRSSLSFCSTLLNMYNKGKIVMCNILLYPIAVCWFGFTLISICLLASVVVSVHSSQLFLFPSDEYSDVGAASDDDIRSEDIPTMSQPAISIDKRSRHSNDCSGSLEGENCEEKDDGPENRKFDNKTSTDSSGSTNTSLKDSRIKKHNKEKSDNKDESLESKDISSHNKKTTSYQR